MATVKLDPAKGVQIPNLTTTERNAISSPETGALIWNTTTSAINQYNGSAWSAVDTSTDNTKLPLAGGTMTGGLTVNAAAVFNETGADVDFRVEASGQDKAIIVNGATGYVGINTTGMAQAPLHILKTAGADTIVPLLILDSNIDVGANGKGGSIVFQELSAYANTAEISAARLGGGGSSEVKFKLRNTDILALRSDGRGLSQFTAKAWVSFNGSSFGIKDSHNVASVTDNGTGDYRVTYTNNMANTDYAPVLTSSYVGSSYNVTAAMLSTIAVNITDILVFIEGGSFQDVTTCTLVAFGD